MAPHKGYIPWNKGKKGVLSEEVRMRISEKMKKLHAEGLAGGFKKGHICHSHNLKEWSKEHDPWNKGKTGEKSHSYGVVFSAERRAKIANRLLGNKNSRPWKHKVTEEHRQECRSRRLLQRFIGKDTKIELKLQDLLSSKGVTFKKQYPLLGKYLADIFVEPNIVIEADGEYWHTRPGRQESDGLRDEELTMNGYKVIRLWDKEINNDINGCWNRLRQHVSQSQDAK